MLLVFTFTVYASGGDSSGLYGSADAVYDGLEKASLHGFFAATGTACDFDASKCATNELRTTVGQFPELSSYIQNDGLCYTSDQKVTEKKCSFNKRSKGVCCDADVSASIGEGQYCRSKSGDCID